MSLYYDITPTVSPNLAVFPGDQVFERRVALEFPKNHLELSAILSTLHIGAHADAPSHYHAKGEPIDRRSIGFYMGKAQVIRLSGLMPKERVEPRHFSSSIQAPRVLFDTQSFQYPERWNAEFNSLSPQLIQFLKQKGVRLVGLDTPSVDPEDSKALESHQALYESDMAVLEGLLLKNVPEGIYTLIALPLKLQDCEASPVRAVLLPHVPAFPEFT